MPTKDPKIGEIWQTSTIERVSQGVVTSVSENRVTLLSQMNRSVSLSLTSFLLTWSFVQDPPDESCEYEGCSFGAILQMRNMGGWRWVCSDHAQPGGEVRFGPSPGVPTTLERCPSCGKSINQMGSGTTEVAGRFLMHWCGICGQRWVRLVGRGTPQDGFWILEALQAIKFAAESFHLQRFRCLVGDLVLASIQRLSPEGPSSISVLSSIPITKTNIFGENQVTFLAQPADWTKGNSLTLDYSNAPVVGSVWWNKSTKERARVVVRQYKGSEIFLDLIIKQFRQEVSLEDFYKTFENRPPTIDSHPIQIGDLWMYCGKVSRVISVSDGTITLRDDGGEHSQTEKSFRKLWIHIPEKSSLERLLEDS